ncbi:MAG: proton-conducting transporter membrane subunit [Acidobacteriota bacterium]
MSASVFAVVTAVFGWHLFSSALSGLGALPALRSKWLGRFQAASGFAVLGAWSWVSWAVLVRGAGGPAEWHLGSLPIPLLVDGLSATFLWLTGLLAAAAGLYSVRGLEFLPPAKLRRFSLVFPLFLAGVTGLFVVDDLSLGFTIAWQLMAVSSFVLIRCACGEGVRRAATVYFAAVELAYAAVTAAVVMLGAWKPGADLPVVAKHFGSLGLPWAAVALGLLLLGFAVKAEAYPFGQRWLFLGPAAAPAPVGALLSGLVMKTGVFGLARVLFWIVPGHPAQENLLWFSGAILAGAGAVTLFLGTAQALRQSDLGRLLALSSVGQGGYILFGLGTAVLLTASPDAAAGLGALALAAVLYHAWNHAVFKSLLFLNAGAVYHATGLRDLNRLGGLLPLLPWTSLLAGFASLSIAGAPATSGFNSKWGLVAAGILAGGERWPLVLAGVVALFTSTMTLACYVKYFGMGFASAGTEWNAERPVREVPAAMLGSQFLLAAVCLGQGLLPGFWYRLAALAWHTSPGSPVGQAVQFPGATPGWTGFVGPPVPGGGVAWALSSPAVLGLLTCGVVAALWLRRSAGAQYREAPTWLGGYRELDSRHRYLDRNLFAPFRSLLRRTSEEPR